MIHLKNLIFLRLLFIIVTVTACTNTKDARYKDVSVLEIPPAMTIIDDTNTQEEAQDEVLKQDLSNIVALAGTEKVPTIRVQKIFVRAWNIVQKALELNNIKIKDKNRSLGVFYVIFAPDTKYTDKSGFVDTIVAFFSNKTPQKSDIQLTVAWREKDSEVTAKLIPRENENDNLLDDEEDKTDFVVPVDYSAALIRTLYDTIKHDLPVN